MSKDKSSLKSLTKDDLIAIIARQDWEIECREIKQCGWVCPKCGAVMSPDQRSCIYCVPFLKPMCNGQCNETGNYINKNTTTIV